MFLNISFITVVNLDWAHYDSGVPFPISSLSVSHLFPFICFIRYLLPCLFSLGSLSMFVFVRSAFQPFVRLVPRVIWDFLILD